MKNRNIYLCVYMLILTGILIGCSTEEVSINDPSTESSSGDQSAQVIEITETIELTATNPPSIEITETLVLSPTLEPTEAIVNTATTPPPVEISYGSIMDGPELFYTDDGETLAGVITLPNPDNDKYVALILGHERDSNYHVWDSLIDELSMMGYTIIAFDIRGHGESSGSKDYSTLKNDVDAVINYLNYQGFDQIVCVGSSQGGTGCLAATLTTESIIGLVMISSPMNIQERHIKKSYMENLTIPKLIMVEENDFANNTTPGFVEDILKMFEYSAEPKQLYLGSGLLHGTALILGDSGAAAREVFMNFISLFVE